MQSFVYWGEVQRRLTEHAAQTGTPYSFYDAVRELWESGEVHEAEQIPMVSFEDWDINDLNELERLMDSTPVKLAIFSSDFRKENSPQRAVRQSLKLESAPIRIAAHQSMGLHTISAMELIYVARGQAQLVLESGGRLLPEHSFSIIPPDLSRDIIVEPDALLLSIALTEQTVEGTLYKLLQRENLLTEFFRSGMSGSPGYLMFHPKNRRQILSALRGILHECYTRGEYSKRIYMNYLEIIFAMLLRQNGEVECRQHAGQRQSALPMLTVLKYIQDHFRTTSLQETAEYFHYEPSYLGKQIKQVTGKNYTEIIREMRIEEAKRLLRDTDMSMMEVALAAGFDSRVNFFRSFRTAMGVTPGDYRKESDIKI